MIDDPRKADVQADEAPEARNREQDDEDAQAQSVAEAARRDRPQEDSDKVSSGDDSDDVQDLVDHMNQMERSGVIDMDAYRGERSDDDEDDELGPGGVEDDEPRGAP
ncbi:hypothetical protein ASE06_03410 [Sphingopyxis sp. Root214]|jgi:hypothetical protein|uniref:hypothetical protein n=1 Tax=unclassified Sphingopyxis TaxID=2614943 RepID=UPI0006FC555A|nr:MULTISPECIES: hypothetical protein [unclassified Sphingopyxis]KQZ77138.1 hypothetical protein ASD73_04580 [Sphingopyxis sp. Root154]KRC08976.1 hypothetical protein ASE06_03410 [Sphingopyxis sp. Root214]